MNRILFFTAPEWIAVLVAVFATFTVIVLMYAKKGVDVNDLPDWFVRLNETCWVSIDSRLLPGKTTRQDLRFGSKYNKTTGEFTVYSRRRGVKGTGTTIGLMSSSTLTFKDNEARMGVLFEDDVLSFYMKDDPEKTYAYRQGEKWF